MLCIKRIARPAKAREVVYTGTCPCCGSEVRFELEQGMDYSHCLEVCGACYEYLQPKTRVHRSMASVQVIFASLLREPMPRKQAARMPAAA